MFTPGCVQWRYGVIPHQINMIPSEFNDFEIVAPVEKRVRTKFYCFMANRILSRHSELSKETFFGAQVVLEMVVKLLP
jgi:hypothetical protein